MKRANWQFVAVLLFLLCAAFTSDGSTSTVAITQLPDPDTYRGRTCDRRSLGCPQTTHQQNYSVQYIVIHGTDGDRTDGAITEFLTNRNKSTHYVVANGRDPIYSEGQIIQMVQDEDTAWTLGIWPTNSVGDTTGPVHHFNSINIEIAGRPNQAGWCTEKMYQSTAALVRLLCQKHGVPMDRVHILGHDECGLMASPKKAKADPCGNVLGRCTFDWDLFMQLVGGVEPAARTATVLVMDTSGSMGYRWQGGVKIESAKEAALQFIYHVEQENLTQGTEHWIGVVGFSSDAHLILPLTNNYAKARSAIISLHATNATNLGAGLLMGLEQVSHLGGEVQRYVTILSDGNTNTGLSKDEILSGPVAQAHRARICLNTVAFGDKNDVDEDFLRRIASPLLGCGRYEYAATGFDLFAAYIKIRHHALGQVISGLSSFGRSVTPLMGQSIPLGTISIPSDQRELQITLGWSEQGTLQLKLYDPSGRQVTSSYSGARLHSSGQFAQAIVASPQAGIWRVEALPLTSMPQGTKYFAIGSTRPGGIAFALPLPVFTIGDRTFALPGNMRTWALVLVSFVCIAVGLWQLLSDAGLL